MSLYTDPMSSSTTSSAPPSTTTAVYDTIGIIAYHAAISQYINSLLQNIPTTPAPTPTTSTSSVLAPPKHELPSQIPSKSTPSPEVMLGENSLLDPNVTIQVLVNDEIKPDLLKDENIEKLPDSSFMKSLSTKRSNLSSVDTQRSNNTRSSNLSDRERDDNTGRRTSRMRSVRVNEFKDDKVEIQIYEMKRQLKFVKRRAELENKIDFWWKGVEDALLVDSISFSDCPPEIPDPIPSPTIPQSYLNRTTSTRLAPGPDSNSHNTSSVSSTTKLPPLKLYNNFPSKEDQLNSPRSSTFAPQDIFSTPCIGPNLGFGFAFDIHDDDQTHEHDNDNDHLENGNTTPKSSIAMNSCHKQQQEQRQYMNSLVFSTKACKATLRCTNSRSSYNIKTTNAGKFTGNKDGSLLDLLDKSKEWDIPFNIEPPNPNEEYTNNALSRSRSKSPFKVIVNGEMPTPKPITAGLSFWG